MRRSIFLVALVLSVLVIPASAQAQCTFTVNVSGTTGTSPQNYTLSWDPVPGALFYRIYESAPLPSFPTTTDARIHTTQQPRLQLRHESTRNLEYTYRVQAIGQGGGEVICEGRRDVSVAGSEQLRTMLRRGIVPVAGSTRGANGALFKTSLAIGTGPQSGRIIFHPAGRPASDNDPQIRYELTQQKPKMEWDDIVAAIGASGIGSLSIIPDPQFSTLPEIIDVRVYNETSTGQFGMPVEVINPIDYYEREFGMFRIHVPATGNFRLNLGGRALTDTVLKMRVVQQVPEFPFPATRERFVAAGEMFLASAESLGINAKPGDTIEFFVVLNTGGRIIPFYTLTENTTNDPFLYVLGGRDDDHYVDQFSK